MVGISLQELGRWQESAEYLDGVLQNENELALSNWCHVHAIQGENYLKGGLLKLAEPHVTRARELAARALEQAKRHEAAGERFFLNRTGYSEAQLTMAKYILATEHYAPAETLLEEFLGLTFPNGQNLRPAARGAALHLLGLARYQTYWEQGGDSSSAEATFRQALDLGSGLLPRDRLGCLVRLAHLAMEESRFEEARALLDQAAQEELLERADPLERTWYGALRNRLAREAEGTRYEPFRREWTQLLEHLRTVQRSSGVAYFRYASAKDIGFEAILQAIAEGGSEAGLATLIQFQNIGFLANQLATVAPTVAEVRACLTPGEVCVLFFAGKGQWIAFGLEREGPVRHWSGPRNFEWHDAIRNLSRAVLQATDVPAGSTETPSWQAQAQSLRDLLFPQDVQDWLRSQQAIRWVGRDLLKNPMFEVLSLGGEPLGLTHAMSDWPSIPVGWHLEKLTDNARAEQAADLDWLLLSAPEWSQAARALDGESTSPDMDFPDDPRVLTLRGDRASVAHWRKSPSTQVVQWLTHGLQQDDPEWATSLVVTPDSELPSGLLDGRSLLEMAEWTLPPLCVLSVCRGDGGFGLEGDPGAGHLAGVLLAKGTQAVVTSRSDASVYLQPTREFHFALRRALVDGDRLDQAVLRARRHVVRNSPFHAAKHWAAWQVIGTGSLQLELTPSLGEEPAEPIPWVWIGIFLLGVGALMAWASRRGWS